ncbi:hypothetical protein NDU88_000566 [Pleurodeles waltl]|uniref:Uncharacterized protein n=1 Tax=Pleurodeles waltl TaxID=8319 RepID=A0AAV7SWW9_PLEWA|nr:hypothetical protein NDU88_000566 [Pleurodeles waltl]
MAQQYPRGISGSGAGDPEGNTPATNKEAHPAEGGIFKPTATVSEQSSDSPGIAEALRREPQWSRAEETTLEPGRQRRQQRKDLSDARWDEQEAARRTDRPRSGKSVA